MTEKHPKRVLIVDDEEVIRDICAQVLGQMGFKTLEAQDAQEALERILSQEIDLLITDIRMPGMSGLELLKQVKEKKPEIIVVMITGYADRDTILAALKGGADDFIAKPIDVLELQKVARNTLKRRELEETIFSLRRMEDMKKRFFTAISHKLKTPLTVIMGFLDILQSESVDYGSDDYKELLEAAINQGKYLDKLIDELLLFQDIVSADGVKLEKVKEVAEIVADVVASLSRIARNRKVNINFDVEEAVGKVLVDDKKIRFALKNVLENAVKFSCEGGEVNVWLAKEDGWVDIFVEDKGEGISEEVMPLVFESAYQVDPEEVCQIEGLGMGLFYAREIIRRHGGSIDIESKKGEGTRVRVRLPLYIEEEVKEDGVSTQSARCG